MLMHKFLCCSLLVFAFELQAKESVNETSEKDDSPAVFSTKFNSSVKDYAGLTVGVGVNIGIHETKVEANREFDAPTRVRATTFGGTIAVGFQKAICGNCFVGFEVGADIGGTGKRARIGGNIRDNSLMMSSYIEDYSRKESILRQIFDNINEALNTHTISSLLYVIDSHVYEGFIRSMRYIGGVGDFSFGNRNNFMTTTASGHGVFYNPGGGYIANHNAVFADFIGERAISNVGNLTGNGLQSGYNTIREFVGANFPAISDALAHMAEQEIEVGIDGNVTGPSVDQNGNVNNDGTVEAGNIIWNVADELHDFFGGDYLLRYENVGVNPAGRDIDALRREIEDLYNPDNSHIRFRLSATEIKALNNFKSKTSFGVCPYAAFKIGYFCKEIQGSVYMKVGIMQLQGYVSAINDFLEKKDNFRKFSPLLAVGVSKVVKGKWGISLELSHTPRTNKKGQDISWKGYKIDNNVSISRTDLRILLTYVF
jgi:hypothetical protein